MGMMWIPTMLSTKNILTQVVNFDEKTTFPVIADPSAWKNCKMCSCNRFDRLRVQLLRQAKVAKSVKIH